MPETRQSLVSLNKDLLNKIISIVAVMHITQTGTEYHLLITFNQNPVLIFVPAGYLLYYFIICNQFCKDINIRANRAFA